MDWSPAARGRPSCQSGRAGIRRVAMARWARGQHMERIQRDLFGPEAVSTALRYRATDNPTLESAWRQSLVDTLHGIRGTTGETREAIVASLAEDLGRLFPASFFEADLRALAAGHDDAIADMALDVQLSGYRDITPTVGKGAPAGVLGIAMPSLTADRVRVIEALQNALTDGGMALVPTRTWSPVAIGEAAGTEDLKTVLDTVKTARGEVALGEFLAANYPHAFEYRHGAGVSAIIVKGTKDPVKLAAMDAQDTGATTERGLPIRRWHEV